jgi:hypothetical protein
VPVLPKWLNFGCAPRHPTVRTRRVWRIQASARCCQRTSWRCYRPPRQSLQLLGQWALVQALPRVQLPLFLELAVRVGVQQWQEPLRWWLHPPLVALQCLPKASLPALQLLPLPVLSSQQQQLEVLPPRRLSLLSRTVPKHPQLVAPEKPLLRSWWPHLPWLPLASSCSVTERGRREPILAPRRRVVILLLHHGALLRLLPRSGRRSSARDTQVSWRRTRSRTRRSSRASPVAATVHVCVTTRQYAGVLQAASTTQERCLRALRRQHRLGLGGKMHSPAGVARVD